MSNRSAPTRSATSRASKNGSRRKNRLSLWERPRAARVRVAYEHERRRSYGTLTPALSQRERGNTSPQPVFDFAGHDDGENLLAVGDLRGGRVRIVGCPPHTLVDGSVQRLDDLAQVVVERPGDRRGRDRLDHPKARGTCGQPVGRALPAPWLRSAG